MKILRISFLIAMFTFFLACKVSKSAEDQREYGYPTNVKVIKFMGTTMDYPIDINDDSFWYYKVEHVIYHFPDSDYQLLREIKELPEGSSKTFRFMTYAFLIKTGETTDTIYADSPLKTWEFVKKGKSTFYYDNEEKIKKKLIEKYSFFDSCW